MTIDPLVYRMPETEGSTHHREAGAGPGVKYIRCIGVVESAGK